MPGRIYSTLGMFQDELEILSLRLQQRSCKVDLLYVGYIVTREENGARDVESWFAQITASIAGKNHYHGKIVERDDISLMHRGGVKRQAAPQNSTNDKKLPVGANAGWRSLYPGQKYDSCARVWSPLPLSRSLQKKGSLSAGWRSFYPG
jgi:hypothetical protein